MSSSSSSVKPLLYFPETTLLGTQYTPSPKTTPEKLMLWAILEDCISEYTLGLKHEDRPYGQEKLRKEREWLESPDERAVGFLFICQHLNIIPEQFRTALYRLVKEVRKDPNGEILPTGVHVNPNKGSAFRYMVDTRHRFATLEQAYSYYSLKKGKRKCA